MVSTGSRMAPNEVRYDRKTYYLVIKRAHNFMTKLQKKRTEKELIYKQSTISAEHPPAWPKSFGILIDGQHIGLIRTIMPTCNP